MAQQQFFALCFGIIPGVPGALSSAGPRGCSLGVLEVGRGVRIRADELVIRGAAWALLLLHLDVSVCFLHTGRETRFPFYAGPGEMSCQRLHLKSVMKLGGLCRALKFRFSARTYI